VLSGVSRSSWLLGHVPVSYMHFSEPEGKSFTVRGSSLQETCSVCVIQLTVLGPIHFITRSDTSISITSAILPSFLDTKSCVVCQHVISAMWFRRSEVPRALKRMKSSRGEAGSQH
jgi:hypothetical protein